MHKGRLWVWFCVAGALAAAGYLMTPWPELASAFFPLFALVSAVAVVIGIRAHRPSGRTWYLFAAALGMFAFGDFLWDTYPTLGGMSLPFPSVADLFFLSAYPFLGLALVSLNRERRAFRDWESIIDAVIVAAAAIIVAWPTLIHPLLHAGVETPFQLLVSIMYPAMDIFALSIAVRCLLALGRRTPSDILLFTGLALLFATDAFYYSATAEEALVTSPWLHLIRIVSSLMVGAAALHPSMTASGPHLDAVPSSLTTTRLLMLVIVSLLGPLVFFLQWMRDGTTQHLWILVLASVGMSLLVFLRLAINADRLKRTVETLGARSRALADSEKRKAAILESALDCIISADAEGRIIEFNPAAEETFGFEQAEVLGRRLDETIIPTRHREAHRRGLERYMAGGGGGMIGNRIEIEALRADGSEFPVELAIAAARQDEVLTFTAHLRDISARRSFESRLRDAEAEYRNLVERLPAVVYSAEVGEEGRWHYVSPQIEALLGFSPEEWKADPSLWFRHIHPEDRSSVMSEEGRALVVNTAFVSEYRMLTREGQEIWVSDEAIPVTSSGSGPTRVQGILVDISERKRLQGQVEHQAFHDSLTQLANRALFKDRVEHALARRTQVERPLAVLFVDLDDFKTVNDSLGHHVGDELLVAVAKRIEMCMRPADTLARLEGDEFAVLIEDMELGSDAAAVAERIVSALDPAFALESRQLFMHASIGIVADPMPEADSDEILRDADTAMYVAKREGKGGHATFEQWMREDIVERLELKAELIRAIDRQEFTLRYQPIYHLTSRTISGVEALVRWQHPTRGLLPPGTFITLAEDTGYIRAIGQWVLRTACRQAKSWQAEFLDPTLSVNVNVSVVQLQEPGLADEVSAALSEAELAPRSLIAEITESVFMQDNEIIRANLRKLKELGVGIAIDDFGTGYSSLGYLHRLPIDIVKIDKSFVDRVTSEGSEGAAVVDAIVRMCHSLRLGTSAEGIETEAQLSLLNGMRCGLGQGFFMAKPLDAGEVAALLAEGQAALGVA
jgi:diguanylate cyclase (GGDEF)-like protein/PAS domain S-box-containing protein